MVNRQKELKENFSALYSSISYHNYKDIYIAPMEGWNEQEISDYTRALYLLCYEGFCMIHSENRNCLEELVHSNQKMSRNELIDLLATAEKYIDFNIMASWREITPYEYRLHRTLVSINRYLERTRFDAMPAVIKISADEIRFK
jgi:hypothetical protein